MGNIDDTDYRHGNNVFKRFKLKDLGEYHENEHKIRIIN